MNNTIEEKKQGSKTKRSPVTPVLLLAIIISSICGIGMYGYLKHQASVAQEEEKRLAIQRQKEYEKRQAYIQDLYDLYLNAFKDELAQKAKAYKTSRKILKDVISPYNYETPEFAKENYTLFETQIAPALRSQSAEIIDLFEVYTKKIQTDLSDVDHPITGVFIEKWMDMSNAQMDRYITFFTQEETMIQNYEALVRFYYQYSKRYEIDMEKNIFVFQNEDDDKKHERLLQDIKPKP